MVIGNLVMVVVMEEGRRWLVEFVVWHLQVLLRLPLYVKLYGHVHSQNIEGTNSVSCVWFLPGMVSEVYLASGSQAFHETPSKRYSPSSLLCLT